MLTLLSQRNFALLWFGQLLSRIGDWVLWIALPFYVYEQTGSALATGAMFIVQTLPAMLFGSVAGVLVDQWDRKWTMIVADLLRLVVVLGLLLIRSPDRLWLIYPIIFVETTISQFFTPAKNALVPGVVAETELLRANTLISLGDDLTCLVGPALGGVLLTLFGVSSVIFLDAASFLISGIMIFLLVIPSELARAQAPRPARIETIGRDWLAGFQLVKANALITALFTIIGIAMLGQGIITVMWIAFVKEILGGGALEYGWVQVAVALGGLAGAAILGRISSLVAPGHLIAISGMALGLLLLATFNLPSLPVILALQFLTGIPAVGFFVTIHTLLQGSVANHYLGRIFGAHNTVTALLILSGQALAGLLGEHLGIVTLLNLAAGLYFSGGAVALVLLTSKIRLSSPQIDYENKH